MCEYVRACVRTTKRKQTTYSCMRVFTIHTGFMNVDVMMLAVVAADRWNRGSSGGKEWPKKVVEDCGKDR